MDDLVAGKTPIGRDLLPLFDVQSSVKHLKKNTEKTRNISIECDKSSFKSKTQPVGEYCDKNQIVINKV